MSEHITRLAYVSHCTEPLDDDSFRQILDRATFHNARNGVTGGLIWFGNRFAQVLEGDHRSVFETFTRLMRDPRHCDICLLVTERAVQRHFTDSFMAAVNDEALMLETLERMGFEPSHGLEALSGSTICAFIRQVCDQGAAIILRQDRKVA